MAPEELHPLEYARHLLENVLGWPAVRTNQELLADCVSVVSKARHITKAGACDWLEVQIGKARKRGIKVNRWWLQEGEYNNLDEEPVFRETYEKIDRAKTEQEQSTAEWQKTSEKARKLWCQIASGQFAPPVVTNAKIKQYQRLDRKVIKQQAAEILAKRSQGQ